MDCIGFLLFAAVGFFSGSVMYSYLIAKWFYKVDIIEQGPDHNPGMTNVMRCVGVGPGVLCLALDFAKGLVPVLVAQRWLDINSMWFALIIAAPVLGHAFSPMLRFKGGKAVAVTFGVFLAASTLQQPLVAYLALLMLVFTTVVKIKPDSLRIIVCMLLFAGLCFVLPAPESAPLAAVLVATTVIFKHITNYDQEKANVRLFAWRK